MRYGYFDDAAREYVIDRPDTPRPWSNYMGDRNYGGLITNHAGGYSFIKSPAHGRIIRFRYNSVPADQPGRQFYVRDMDSGDYWSAAWQPVGKPLDQYKSVARFGTNYTTIESDYSGIHHESTYFIPMGKSFEYWALKLRNDSDKPRNLRVFTFCEFTSEFNMLNDLLNLQYTMHIVRANYADNMIGVKSCGNLPTVSTDVSVGDRARCFWIGMNGGKVTGYDCDREKFIGAYNSFHNPEAVVRGECFNSYSYSDNACGSLQNDIVLQPGESIDLTVVLGSGTPEKEGARIMKEYANPERVAVELEKLKAHWHSRIDVLKVKTPDSDFDHMVNVWNSYNSLITFEWCRAVSLIYTGDQRDGFGYRDAVQDCIGAACMIPEQVKERLVIMLSAQESNGGAQPEVRPWELKPGQMKKTPDDKYRSDDCQWLFEAVPAYVKETGDVGFYNEVVPYADKEEGTVFDHLRRALTFNLERKGAHDLPCGLLADWNDCLKLGYHGESVFVTFQVRRGLERYAEIANLLGKPDEAAWADIQRKELDKAIQKICWDGEWFIWAIGEDGTVYGTKNFPEGQVYINTQAWAIMSGAATEEQTKIALDTMDKRLFTKFGLKLCDPHISTMKVEVMRAMLFNAGNKENGGIFSHPQSWGVLAEIAAGDGDRAYKYYHAFMPSAQNDIADHRVVEPFVHCQSSHADSSPKFGTSRVPWLSGTASWATYSAQQGILGLIPELEGFRIDPCIPHEWPGFSAERKFRGKLLKIEVVNKSGVCKGVKKLTVNGKVIEGNLVPLSAMTDVTEVAVEM
ncbi:MAG: N,N'-diacetylchitobiose phosphorylase [Opitutales bacterium]|jgi:cellobiose phosphorylase